MNGFYRIKYIGNLASDLASLPLLLHGALSKPRRHKTEQPLKNILIMKFWGIGNITLLLPILNKIGEQYPSSAIYFITLDSNRGLLENFPQVTKVFYIKLTTNGFKIFSDFIKYVFALRTMKIDLLLNFEQSNKLSIIFGYLTGANTRVGFEVANCSYNSLYTKVIKNNVDLHVSQNFSDLARKAGIIITRYGYTAPNTDSYSIENAANTLKRFGLEKGRIVALHIGSGENFKGKRWPSSNFAALADGLVDRYGVSMVYTGTQKERILIEEAISRMKYKALNLAGYFTLPELVEFLKRCYLFISNDTGPLHIAISLGINTAGVYGPMDPRQYGSLNKNSLSFYKPIGCSPCLTDLNNKTSFCKNSKCLENITADEVLEALSRKFFGHFEHKEAAFAVNE